MVLGDLSIQGNIKSVRSLAEPLQVGMDNGARRALIPLENKRNFLEVFGGIVERVDPAFFSDPMKAAMKALGMTKFKINVAGESTTGLRRGQLHRAKTPASKRPATRAKTPASKRPATRAKTPASKRPATRAKTPTYRGQRHDRLLGWSISSDRDFVAPLHSHGRISTSLRTTPQLAASILLQNSNEGIGWPSAVRPRGGVRRTQTARLDMSFEHGQPANVARAGFQEAIRELQSRFPDRIERVVWADNGRAATLTGSGYEVRCSTTIVIFTFRVRYHWRGSSSKVWCATGSSTTSTALCRAAAWKPLAVRRSGWYAL